MKRLSGIVLLAVLLLLPEGIYAERPGIISFNVDELEYTNLGDTVVQKSRKGAIRILTVGLEGEGEINCNDNVNCIDAGLEGETLNIQQVLQVKIDLLSRGGEELRVRGRTVFSFKINQMDRNFKGRIFGTASGDANLDGIVVAMNISAKTKGGGKVELQLHGELIREIVPDGLRWEDLEGSFAAAINPTDFGPYK